MGGYDIYGPPYSNGWSCGGIKGVSASAVAVTPDHKVWVSSGVNCGPYAGQLVATFTNNGSTLSTIEAGIPFGATNTKVSIDYGQASGRMYVSSVFQAPSPNVTYLSYTNVDVPTSNFAAKPGILQTN